MGAYLCMFLKEFSFTEYLVRKTTIKFSDQDTNVDVEQCIRVHAIAGARTLVSSKPVLSMLGDQGLQILPAFYHLKDGQVEWLAES